MASAQPADKTVNCAASLHECVYGPDPRIADFEFEAKVTFVRNSAGSRIAVALEDATGVAVAYADDKAKVPAVGDLVRICGHTERNPANLVIAAYQRLQVIGKATATPPPVVTGADIVSGRSDCRPVVVRGIIRDAIVPETNHQWLLLALNCDGEIIYLSTPNLGSRQCTPEGLIGSTVAATGLCLQFGLGFHNYAGRIVFLSAISDLELRAPPPTAFDGYPDIRYVNGLNPMDVTRLGPHRLSGTVLVVWNGRDLLIRTDGGKHAKVRLITADIPNCGEQIEAAGFPESDFFQINLTNARWHRLPQAPSALERPASFTDPRALFVTTSGHHRINASYQGKTVRLRGTVVGLPKPDDHDGRVFLDCDGLMIAVDFSAQESLLERLTPGCVVDICGTCLLEFDNYTAPMILPRAKGLFLVVRSPNDLAILSHPPWWTPTRLAAAIGTLLLMIFGILIWTNSLRRLAERRGQELMKERIDGVKSKLRLDERTRLAVELHDSIAQTLTGISMELAANNVELAARMVKSCHKDLRNCLWDLRSQTLEEQDMTKAVLNTLKPHVNDSRVAVRFNVPRSSLTDTTAHDLLCIIRELVINALRHGKATSVKVAGSVDGDAIRCSVADNGCGFDPEGHPGAAEGHFGLQGITERIHKHHGSCRLDSKPGHGCKATITIPHSP